MLAKVWSMGLVVLVAAAAVAAGRRAGAAARCRSQGSMPLFLAGAAVHLFATTSLGIFLATVARSMPQFGLLARADPAAAADAVRRHDAAREHAAMWCRT